MKLNNREKAGGVALALAASALLVSPTVDTAPAVAAASPRTNQVLEWNQIFVDTLIATNTANSSSQRLGAIVHTAIFDAYNGIERRYTPIFVGGNKSGGASRRAAVIAAAYTALVGLFPSQQPALDASYEDSLETLNERCATRAPAAACARRIGRGIEWGTEVAHHVLAWRATDGFGASYPPFTGGMSVGQWRPTPPAFAPMSAQGLAFTSMFVLASNSQFAPQPPRTLASPRMRTTSRLSRRSGDGSDRRAPRTSRRSPSSGRATPASTGIKRPTRWRAPTTSPSPTATGCSPS